VQSSRVRRPRLSGWPCKDVQRVAVLGFLIKRSQSSYEQREQEREAKRLQASLSPQRGPRLSTLSLELIRTSTKYKDRPAAAMAQLKVKSTASS
jgi:hypothetical protein